MFSIFLLPALLLLGGTSAHPALSPRVDAPFDALRLQSLYNTHAPPSALARLFRAQGPLIPHPSSSVNMQSTPPLQPITVTTSPAVCAPLAHEVACLTTDLLLHLLHTHPNGTTLPLKKQNCHDKPVMEIDESVSMEMDGRDYRATVELALNGTVEAEQWNRLIRLLGKTMGVIEEGKGMGRIVMGTVYEGVDIKATWTFYEVVNGVADRCV